MNMERFYGILERILSYMAVFLIGIVIGVLIVEVWL